MPGIGQLNEGALHASLREWYARPGDRFEVPVDGFIIDIVRDGRLLEIQTASLASIKIKLRTLCASHRVRLIYPIAREKWIVKLANDRGKNTRRKSPKKGRVEDLFWELVSFPQLLGNPNFCLEILLIKAEEVQRFVGGRHWRRKGWIIEERRLLEVVESHVYGEPEDWRVFLPEGLETFTAKDLAEASGVRTPLAQKMVYCLRNAGLIELIGKRERANLYRVPAASATARAVSEHSPETE